MAKSNNTVEVRSGGSARYQLHQAILLYRNLGGNDVHATLHPVERHRKGGAHLGAGVPATLDACAAFASSIVDRAAFAGFLSAKMLYVGPRLVAWWRAPASARVWFKTQDEDPAKNIGERSAITPHPGLVFACCEADWYVYAVKSATRPEPATPIFRAPYFNVWGKGHICEGNIERPKQVTPQTIERFERAFFESRFTHPNIHKGLTQFHGGGYAFWRALLDGRWKRFPEQHLVPEGKQTLETLMRDLQGRKHAHDD